MLALLLAFAILQSLLPKPGTLQHIDVIASVSAETVAKGGAVTLWAEVMPKANIHVYATEKYGFTPVSLVFGAQPRLTFGTVKYPTPEAGISPGTDILIPMYTKPFRLTQTVTLSPSAKSGDLITISGAVNYEACNDRLCFPATSLPVTWVVTVK